MNTSQEIIPNDLMIPVPGSRIVHPVTVDTDISINDATFILPAGSVVETVIEHCIRARWVVGEPDGLTPGHWIFLCYLSGDTQPVWLKGDYSNPEKTTWSVVPFTTPNTIAAA